MFNFWVCSMNQLFSIIKTIRFRLLIVVFFFLLFSCKSTQRAVLIQDSYILSKYSKVFNDSQNESMNICQNFALAIGDSAMPKITAGINVRLWFWNLSKEKYYVEITTRDSERQIRVTAINSVILDTSEFVLVSSRWKVALNENEWNELVSLYLTKISGLKGKDLANDRRFGAVTGLSAVSIELKQNGVYSISNFQDPAYFSNVDADSRQLYRFLVRLNKNIGFDVYKHDKLRAKRSNPRQ